MQVNVSTPAVPVAVLQVRQEEVQVDLDYLQTEMDLNILMLNYTVRYLREANLCRVPDK